MTKEPLKDVHPLDEIMADFSVYINPKVLKAEVSELIDVSSANIKEIEKYQSLLRNIEYAWNKILKYQKYFEVFYPHNEEVENFEALNHHIHAYLQDMDTLKNKIEVFLGALKNDVKKIASNKEEVIVFIDAGISKTYEVFDGVLKHRHPHVHKGPRFMDNNLLKSENAHGALEMFSNPIFESRLNPEYKEEFFGNLEKEKEASFEAGKAHWIKMAQDNNEQVSGYLAELFSGVRPSLYQFLNITAVKDLINASEK